MNCTDNGSLSRVVASRFPVMRRSASSDAILTSYLYGRWPKLDALHTRAVQELRLQPRSSDNSVPDQAALDDISVSYLNIVYAYTVF